MFALPRQWCRRCHREVFYRVQLVGGAWDPNPIVDERLRPSCGVFWNRRPHAVQAVTR